MSYTNKGSSSERPDLDWSQVRETISMLTLAVAQMETTMTDGDQSVGELSQSFTYIADNITKLVDAGNQLSDSTDTAETIRQIQASSHEIHTKVNQAIIAFQFYDRLTQRLHHVKADLLHLSQLISDPSRLYNPNEWKKLQHEISQNHTMEEERIMFEHIMQGASVEEALLIYQHHFQNKKDSDDHTGDDVELF